MNTVEVEFKRYLSARKLKYTPERRKIFKEIFQSNEHFDADQLFGRLKAHDNRVSRATVYRTLDLLLRLGLVTRVCLGEKSALYVNADHWTRHGHLVCISCGRIQEFPVATMEKSLEDACCQHNFSAKSRCIQISGYCEDCTNKSLIEMTRRNSN